jgi:hypothetical protein
MAWLTQFDEAQEAGEKDCSQYQEFLDEQDTKQDWYQERFQLQEEQQR